MIDTYLERFNHPYLFTLVPIGCLLFALAIGADAMGMTTRSAFLGLYAIVMVIICTIGYLAFGTLRFATQTLAWWRIRNGGRDEQPETGRTLQ